LKHFHLQTFLISLKEEAVCPFEMTLFVAN